MAAIDGFCFAYRKTFLLLMQKCCSCRFRICVLFGQVL